MKAGISAWFSTVFICSCVPVAVAQNPSATPVPEKSKADLAASSRTTFVAPVSEAAFVKAVFKSGLLEAGLAEIALVKSEEIKVRDFAQMVAKEQTASNKELKAVAEGFGLALDLADDADNVKKDKFGKKSGKEFDEAFLEEMAACHANDMALFEAGKKVSTSREVTAFIDKTLPVIQRRSEKINLMGPGAHRPDAGNSPPKAPAPDAPPAPGSKPVSMIQSSVQFALLAEEPCILLSHSASSPVVLPKDRMAR